MPLVFPFFIAQSERKIKSISTFMRVKKMKISTFMRICFEMSRVFGVKWEKNRKNNTLSDAKKNRFSIGCSLCSQPIRFSLVSAFSPQSQPDFAGYPIFVAEESKASRPKLKYFLRVQPHHGNSPIFLPVVEKSRPLLTKGVKRFATRDAFRWEGSSRIGIVVFVVFAFWNLSNQS